jgi:sortase (surface protein transpeptidase)
LEKAAEGLIWKVEKEEKFKQQQAEEAERKKEEKKRKAEETGVEEEEEEEEQYDCMISYSWADMDLAHKIFHHLTEKLGYKVWLDQEQMHGSTIEAMVCFHTSILILNSVFFSYLLVGKCS